MRTTTQEIVGHVRQFPELARQEALLNSSSEWHRRIKLIREINIELASLGNLPHRLARLIELKIDQAYQDGLNARYETIKCSKAESSE